LLPSWVVLLDHSEGLLVLGVEKLDFDSFLELLQDLVGPGLFIFLERDVQHHQATILQSPQAELSVCSFGQAGVQDPVVSSQVPAHSVALVQLIGSSLTNTYTSVMVCHEIISS
jgi:hypothetical protein